MFLIPSPIGSMYQIDVDMHAFRYHNHLGTAEYQTYRTLSLVYVYIILPNCS